MMKGCELSVLDTRSIETLDDHFAAHKCFDGQRRETIETKAEACQDDHDVAIVSWEIVQYVSLCRFTEDEVASERHDHACKA